MLQQFCRDVRTAHELADATIALCNEHGFTYYWAWATIIRGWIGAVQEHNAVYLAQMQQGMDVLQATGGCIRYHYYRALLAEAYSHVGQIDQGCRVLSEAFTDLQNTGECWWEAELHRLRGELQLQAADAGQHVAFSPEACFLKALQVAQRQQTKSLGLRAALSLSRLWQQQGRRDEAWQLLAPIYTGFTEGFHTPDLQEAQALLEALLA
jgi:predicted ATPase